MNAYEFCIKRLKQFGTGRMCIDCPFKEGMSELNKKVGVEDKCFFEIVAPKNAKIFDLEMEIAKLTGKL